MNESPQQIQPLSSILAETLEGDHPVTVGELVDHVARRGFGLLMIVLALPTMIPVLPPGSAATIGLLYILLSGQMLVGLEKPWLPRGLRSYRLSPRAITALRLRGVPFLQRIERFSRPRFIMLDDWIIARLVALAVLILGIVLLSPLPFLNTLPALAVLILGVGLLNRDGLFLLGGLLLATAVVFVIVFGAGTLYSLLNAVLTWLRSR